MGDTNKKWAIVPVMLCFFAMGFVDLVGIASNYVKEDMHLNDATANILAQGGLSVAGGCRCLTKDGNTSIEKEGYIPYPLQA